MRLLQTKCTFYSGVFFMRFTSPKDQQETSMLQVGRTFMMWGMVWRKRPLIETLPQLHSILHTSSRPDLAGVQAARVEVAGLAPNWDGVPAYLVLVLQSAQANLHGSDECRSHTRRYHFKIILESVTIKAHINRSLSKVMNLKWSHNFQCSVADLTVCSFSFDLLISKPSLNKVWRYGKRGSAEKLYYARSNFPLVNAKKNKIRMMWNLGLLLLLLLVDPLLRFASNYILHNLRQWQSFDYNLTIMHNNIVERFS